VVSALVQRLRLACADVPPPREAPDTVHADLATPSNILVRGGAVVAVVDIANAGSGTRATALTTLAWYTVPGVVKRGHRALDELDALR
jgi:aminoglycoside phosphotransferase (APT) family kinase protein